MNSHENQPRTFNGNMLGVALASGALALGAVSTANAAPAAPDAEAVITQLLPEVQAQTRSVPQGAQSEVVSVKDAINTIKSGVGEDTVQKVTLKQSGSKLSFGLKQQDHMTKVVLGSIFTEEYTPGYGGVQGSRDKEYSKMFPYLMSPDLVSQNTVSVQAATKNGKKWKNASKAVKMPNFDNFGVAAMDTTPAKLTESGLEGGNTSPVEGYSYDASNPTKYVKSVNSNGSLKLSRPLTAAQKRDGVYLKVTQRWSPRSSKYGKQDQGTKVSIYGPFKGKKQSKNTSIAATEK